MAKQVNIKNNQPDARATCPFELGHTDLPRPKEPVAKYGFKYVISFTDDFSGFLCTYFLKKNSNLVNFTKTFLADISPDGRLKSLSFCDDVFLLEKLDLFEVIMTEYLSEDFRDLLIQNSIKTNLLHHIQFTKMVQPGCIPQSKGSN